MSVREPILKPVAIADLRPTQMTVGVREVKEKRKRCPLLTGNTKRTCGSSPLSGRLRCGVQSAVRVRSSVCASRARACYGGKPLTGYWTVVQYRTRRMLRYCRKNAVDFTDSNAGRRR
jgi:hypothetical protein